MLHYKRLEVLEGIPGLISHPRVRLGVCVQSWYAVATMEVFFFFFLWCQVVFCVKSNQPRCCWKSKWNLSYLFLRASLWFFTKKKLSGLSPRRWPCDKARMNVCLFAFLVAQKLKTVKWKKKNPPCANALPFESGRGALSSDEKTI